MLLKFAVIFCFVGIVELRPQNIDNFEHAEDTNKHNHASEIKTDYNHSALLDNRYSGNKKFSQINVFSNNYNKDLSSLIHRYTNSPFKFASNHKNLFLLNDPERINHDSKSNLVDQNFAVRKTVNKAMTIANEHVKDRLINSVKSNVVNKIVKAINYIPLLNDNSKPSNVINSKKSSRLNNLKHQSRNYINLLPEQSKIHSNVVQFWDPIPAGNSMNTKSQIGRNNYDIKKFTFGNQTSTIIMLAKNDKLKTYEESNLKAKNKNLPSDFKNWPDEDLHDNHDINNYEQYTSLRIQDKNYTEKLIPLVEFESIKDDGTEETFDVHNSKWEKIPTVVLDEKPINNYEPVYSNFEPNKPLILLNSYEPNANENTNAGTMNSNFHKNIPFVSDSMHSSISQVTHDTMIHIHNPSSQKNISSDLSKLGTNYGPPKNVHIVFASNDNETNLYKSQLNNTFNADCPTITINTITQVNNTIQSKEGCTDLNIIINSHILNNNINNVDKLSSNGEEDFRNESEPNVSSFEVFQGTHININTAPTDETVDSVIITSDTENNEMDNVTEGSKNSTDPDYSYELSTDENKDELETLASDVVEGEPNVINPETQAVSQATNNVITPSPTTALAVTEDEGEDEEEEDDIYSPFGIMEYFTSLFSRYTYLNPLNYGIFSMTVAPFAAFAAGVIGVATFLFPWAFPGAFDLARSQSYSTIDFTRDINQLFLYSNQRCDRFAKFKKKCRQRKR